MPRPTPDKRGPYDPAVSPTPWFADDLNVRDLDGRTLASALGTRTVGGDTEANRKETERDLRNAKLFAAAPELLAALEALYSVTVYPSEYSDAARKKAEDMAEKALAKAQRKGRGGA